MKKYLMAVAIGLNAFVLEARERPSLKALLSELKSGSEISKAYGSREPVDSKSLDQWLKSNEALRQNFQKMVQESQAFVRGEIEDEKTLNDLTIFLQLSLLRCRGAESVDICASEAKTWFAFFADLAYEESSLIGLRLAHLGRSLWFDEIESRQTKNRMFLARTQFLNQLRAPWPLDRILVFEARRSLKPKDFKTVETLSQMLSKNPYQSAELALRKIPGGKAKDFDFIRQMWRTEDVDLLKTEANRLALLKVKAAQAAFYLAEAKVAGSYQDLLTQKLISQIPTDYKTGKALVFPAF